MESFIKLTSSIVPLPHNNVDTDQIIPASYLKVTSKDGLAEGLFAGWCYSGDGNQIPDFPLNRPEHEGARILLAGDNFGCGSSREHAAWALLARGFQVVISTSFADIFRNNALKNGLLPVEVSVETQQRLFDLVQENPKSQVEIDLARQTLTLPDGLMVSFPIDEFSKICMLEGVDQLGYLLKQEPEIAAFEQRKGK